MSPVLQKKQDEEFHETVEIPVEPKRLYQRWWFWVIVIVLVIGVISSGRKPEEISTNSNDSDEGTSEVREYPEIASSVLASAYQDNEVAADGVYRGEVYIVKGAVQSVKKDLLDNPFVVLKGATLSVVGVQCVMGVSAEDRLAQVQRGQEIEVVGTIAGQKIGHVLLDDCRFLE